jgi:hypothetical protein
MTDLIIIQKEELEGVVYKTLQRFDSEKNRVQGDRLFTINQVAKRLGKSHATIKKLVGLGIIKSNRIGLISEQTINDFLKST